MHEGEENVADRAKKCRKYFFANWNTILDSITGR